MENKPCIICLEDTDVFTINDFIIQQPILKSCKCLYNIHANCIIEWIRNNPACPYCKEQLYLLNSPDIVPINCTHDIEIISIPNDNRVENENTPLIYVTDDKQKYCIRNALICSCILLIMLFVGNISYY
jgi:hypothetical protein